MTWEELPPSARVWIYSADRQLTEKEVESVNTALADFTTQWTAHNQALRAYGDVIHGRFLRLAVDQTKAGASGCSIDASVHYLQRLGQQLKLDFFDRTTFFADNGEGFLPYPREEFAEAYAKTELNDDSPVVDTLVDNKAKFDDHFVRPLSESWHARML